MRFTLDNRSGYDTSDLKRFITRGFRHWKPRGEGVVRITIVSSPIRTRGCGEVGGRRMVIAIAPPSRYSLRRFVRVFDHEMAHIAGLEHDDMPRDVLYSMGPVPRWADDTRIRYTHRAPDQMKLLARRKRS